MLFLLRFFNWFKPITAPISLFLKLSVGCKKINCGDKSLYLFIIFFSNTDGGDPIGFLTSPWYHPEKKTNIAMGYVPYDGTLNSNGFPKGKVGTKYKVHLPEKYSNTPGVPVDAVVVDIPFKESYNANTREVVKG